MVIIVFGLPGAGKSFFAKALAEKVNGKHISSDQIRKRLFDKPSYSYNEKVVIYKQMFDLMCDYAYRKKHLILDGTFYSRNIRDQFIDKMKSYNLDLMFIEICADETTIKSRFNAPESGTTDANYDIYSRIALEFEPLLQEHLTLVSSNQNIDSMIGKALAYLNLTTYTPDQ